MTIKIAPKLVKRKVGLALIYILCHRAAIIRRLHKVESLLSITTIGTSNKYQTSAAVPSCYSIWSVCLIFEIR